MSNIGYSRKIRVLADFVLIFSLPESITDKKEIEDRFYKDLEFGTGGLRGIMGAGANRMNKYTVGKATKGLCEYLKNEFAGERSVVIAYDSRNNSKAFAECAAEILCYNGIKTFLFEEIMPTPVLSFSVRYFSMYSSCMGDLRQFISSTFSGITSTAVT